MVNKLLKYIEKNNYVGYDPYDLKGKKWYMSLDNNLRNEFDRLNFLYPKELRKLFSIKPKLNNKALALIALSYLNLNKIKKAKKIANLLLTKSNKNFSGYCWGYPFDWKSGDYLFKKNTPSIVVTFYVAQIYLKLYKITKQKRYLKILKSILKFVLNDLNKMEVDNKICFSYTPYDNYQIHNANLMGAEFLAQMGKILQRDDLLNLAKKSVYFTISQQNKDGSIYYYGDNSSKIASTHLDIYHSGFEIKSLINLYKILKDKNIKESYQKYSNFFINQYFLENKIPKLAPKIKNYKTDIVDIHGVAEALLTLNELNEYTLLNNVYTWTKENMWNKNYFIYRWIRNDSKIDKIDIAYMRWGEAWMLYALTSIKDNLG